MADVRQPGRFQSFCAAGVPDSFFRERRRDLQGGRTGRRVLCCWPTFSSRRLPHQISTSPRTTTKNSSPCSPSLKIVLPFAKKRVGNSRRTRRLKSTSLSDISPACASRPARTPPHAFYPIRLYPGFHFTPSDNVERPLRTVRTWGDFQLMLEKARLRAPAKKPL